MTLLFSPDNRVLADASTEDGSVTVYSLDAPDRTPLTLRAKAHRLCFNRDGSALVITDGNSSWSNAPDRILVWRPSTRTDRPPSIMHMAESFPDTLEAVALSTPDTNTQAPLVAASLCRCRHGFIHPSVRPPQDVPLDPDISLFDATTGARVCKLSGPPQGNIHHLLFSPNAQLLAASSPDTLTLWNMDASPYTLVIQHEHPQHYGPLAFAPEGDFLACGSEDGIIRIFDTRARRQSRSTCTPPDNTGQPSNIIQLAYWREDAHQLLSLSAGGCVRLWKLDRGTSEAQLVRTIDASWGEAFSPDLRFMARRMVDGEIQLRETLTGLERPSPNLRQPSSDEAERIRRRALSEDDERMLAATMKKWRAWSTPLARLEVLMRNLELTSQPTGARARALLPELNRTSFKEDRALRRGFLPILLDGLAHPDADVHDLALRGLGDISISDGDFSRVCNALSRAERTEALARCIWDFARKRWALSKKVVSMLKKGRRHTHPNT